MNKTTKIDQSTLLPISLIITIVGLIVGGVAYFFNEKEKISILETKFHIHQYDIEEIKQNVDLNKQMLIEIREIKVRLESIENRVGDD